MKKFPSIESFTHLVRKSKDYANRIGVPLQAVPSLKYKGTVKLHGTNGGVRVEPDGTVIPQSRENQLDLKNTNAGFATFVLSQPEWLWPLLADRLCSLNNINAREQPVTIYGEWCGCGIQKGTALTQVDKHFVIFHAAYGELELEVVHDASGTFNIHSVENGIYNINQIPTYDLVVDFSNLEAASEYINKVTMEVEAECPWVKLMFGQSGIGEGIVWIPVGRVGETNLWFKSKGDKHKVRSNPTKNVAPVDVEKVNSIKECVDIILTENRMEQMVHDNNLPFKMTAIGPFLKALAADILKEESHVLLENKLDWKDVGKLVQSLARTWFVDQINKRTFES